MAPSTRTAAAYALVLLAPAAAWLTWVSWADGKPSDAAHVAWFATVAAGSLGAGALAARARAWGVHLAVLAALGAGSTMVTLWLWWSSEDDSGLFVIGIVLATPLVCLAAPALLQLGRLAGSRGTRGIPGTPATRGTAADG